MNQSAQRQMLLQQYDHLRYLMMRCEILADELDAGNIERRQLDREVERLRIAFDFQNRAEAALLAEAARHDAAVAASVIAASPKSVCDTAAAAITATLRRTLWRMREHLEREERALRSTRYAIECVG